MKTNVLLTIVFVIVLSYWLTEGHRKEEESKVYKPKNYRIKINNFDSIL